MSPMRLLVPVGLLAASSALFAPNAAAGPVDLTVTETAGAARSAEPVTTGVPFARGVLRDVSGLSLHEPNGVALPAQFRVLSKWPDGSVRVVLVDTQATVPANGSVKLTLSVGGAAGFQRQVILQGGGQVRIEGRVEGRVQVGGAVGGGNVQPQVRVMIDGQEVDLSGRPAGPTMPFEEGPEAITLSPGPLEITVSKERFNLFQSIKLNGRELLADGGARIVLTTEDGRRVTTGDVPPSEVKIEEIGPLRAVILARGRLADLNNKLLGYTCRITAYAGKPYVKVSFWLENDGRYGYTGRGEWFLFDGLSIELPVKATEVACEGSRVPAGSFELRQDNESGRGDPKAFKYTMTGGDGLPGGQRASGRLTLQSPNAAINLAVKDFWQNYPKGLRVADGTLAIDLWPTWGQWPRTAPGTRSSEGLRKAGLYSLPGGARKRHEMLFEFAAPGAARDIRQTAAVLDQPLMLLAPSQYYADTEALTAFAPGDYRPADPKASGEVERWNTWARNVADPANPRGIVGTRQSCNYGPFFGWMDFGDLAWQPGSSQLHYDWTWVMLLNYLRLGDRAFLDRAAEMAPHRIDVDQLWTDRDLPAFNHLTAYEKGFADVHHGVNDGHYKPITSHNWVRGVVWWYWLTGDESAREAAVANAQGVKNRQVDAHANADRLGDQPRSSSWAIECLVDVYDLTAERQYLDWAESLWTNHLKPLWKQKGPAYGMTGGNVLQYYYGAGPLVMLHQRTADAELLQYMRDLCDHCDDPKVWTTYTDDMASNMTNVYAYVGLLDKDARRLARAGELFVEAMKRDNNLVLWAGSGAYTKEVCKKLRNGHVWLWAERQAAARD